MKQFLTQFLMFVVSMLGWKPKPARTPAPKTAGASPLRPARTRIRTEPEEARDAVHLLDRFQRAHVYGVVRPTVEEASVAWTLLERICLQVAGFVRACVALEKGFPLCRRGQDATEWLVALLRHVSENIETVVAGICAGASLQAWRAVEDLMHRQVQHALRSCNPILIYLNGPEARREVHVRDSVRSKEHPQGRVIISRLYEHGRNGRLEIIDGGGRLSRETVDRSGWTVCDGWVAIVGPAAFQGRRPDEEDAPVDENTPPSGFHP